MSEATLLRANPLATQIKEEVARQVGKWTRRGVQPRMAVVIASADPASVQYLQSNQQIAAELGISLDISDLGEVVRQEKLNQELQQLSADSSVHGILLQLPLPAHLNTENALDQIDPRKDVDGLTVANLGLIAANREAEAIVATTPQACIALAESYFSLTGKSVIVIGRGRTVGRPLISLLVNRQATVTVCHSRTSDLAAAVASCQVVMVAVGKPGFLPASYLRPGQVVIDAGISVIEGKTRGDVEPEAAQIVEAITPVPGGVGALTSVLIFRNLLKAISRQEI